MKVNLYDWQIQWKKLDPKGRRITNYICSTKTLLISLLRHFTKGKDLVKPGLTPFATSYFTLRCFHDNKGSLIRMFASDQWKISKFARSMDGKLVEDVVLDMNLCLMDRYCKWFEGYRSANPSASIGCFI